MKSREKFLSEERRRSRTKSDERDLYLKKSRRRNVNKEYQRKITRRAMN